MKRYEQASISRRDQELQVWSSARPAGPCKVLVERGKTLAEPRLLTPGRHPALDRLDEINRRWADGRKPV